MIIKHKALDDFKWTYPMRDLMVEMRLESKNGIHPSFRPHKLYVASGRPATGAMLFRSAVIKVPCEEYEAMCEPEAFEHMVITRILTMLDRKICEDEQGA